MHFWWCLATYSVLVWNKHSVLHFKQKSGDNKADSLCQDTHTMMTRFTSFFSKIQYTNNCKTIIKISSNDNWSTLVMANKNFLLQGNSTYHSGPDDATNCQQQIKKTRRLAQKREKLANQLSFKLQQPRPLLTWAVVHSWVQLQKSAKNKTRKKVLKSTNHDYSFNSFLIWKQKRK